MSTFLNIFRFSVGPITASAKPVPVQVGRHIICQKMQFISGNRYTKAIGRIGVDKKNSTKNHRGSVRSPLGLQGFKYISTKGLTRPLDNTLGKFLSFSPKMRIFSQHYQAICSKTLNSTRSPIAMYKFKSFPGTVTKAGICRC